MASPGTEPPVPDSPEAWGDAVLAARTANEAARAAYERAQVMLAAAEARQAAGQTAEFARIAEREATAARTTAAHAGEVAERAATAARVACETASAFKRLAEEAEAAALLADGAAHVAAANASGAERRLREIETIVADASTTPGSDTWGRAARLLAGPGETGTNAAPPSPSPAAPVEAFPSRTTTEVHFPPAWIPRPGWGTVRNYREYTNAHGGIDVSFLFVPDDGNPSTQIVQRDVLTRDLGEYARGVLSPGQQEIAVVVTPSAARRLEDVFAQINQSEPSKRAAMRDASTTEIAQDAGWAWTDDGLLVKVAPGLLDKSSGA